MRWLLGLTGDDFLPSRLGKILEVIPEDPEENRQQNEYRYKRKPSFAFFFLHRRSMDGSDSKPRFERKAMSGVDDTDGAGLGPHHDGLTGRPIGREVNPIEVVAIRYTGSSKHDFPPC